MIDATRETVIWPVLAALLAKAVFRWEPRTT
jgi:hypothetical protein